MTNNTTLRIIVWEGEEIIDIQESQSFDAFFTTRKDGKLTAYGQENFDWLRSQAMMGREIQFMTHKGD